MGCISGLQPWGLLIQAQQSVLRLLLTLAAMGGGGIVFEAGPFHPAHQYFRTAGVL